jgi:hypothetical protein
MKQVKCIVFLVIILFLGCEKGQPGKSEVSYYPLDEGMTWVYYIYSGENDNCEKKHHKKTPCLI